MNTPAQTAQALIDLAVHHAAVAYHNPALRGVAAVAAVTDSVDDHFLVCEALISLLGMSCSVGPTGNVKAAWHHTTKNGHTYLCRLKVVQP